MLTAKFLGVIPVFSLLSCHNLRVPLSNPCDVTHLSEKLQTVLSVFHYRNIPDKSFFEVSSMLDKKSMILFVSCWLLLAVLSLPSGASAASGPQVSGTGTGLLTHSPS